MAHLDGWPCLQDSPVWQWASPLQVRHWRCEDDLILSKESTSLFHKLPSSHQFLLPHWGTGFIVPSFLRGPQGSRSTPTTPAPREHLSHKEDEVDSGAELFRWTLKRTRALWPSSWVGRSWKEGGGGTFVMLSPLQHAAPSWQHSFQEVLLLLLWVSGEKREVLECRREVGRRAQAVQALPLLSAEEPFTCWELPLTRWHWVFWILKMNFGRIFLIKCLLLLFPKAKCKSSLRSSTFFCVCYCC